MSITVGLSGNGELKLLRDELQHVGSLCMYVHLELRIRSILIPSV